MFATITPLTAHGHLTTAQAEAVTASLPAVATNISQITPLFYRKMFAAHPELIQDTFNRGNQNVGAQQKALAASVATFATMLVDPAAPDPVDMLARIGHKHVSVGITEAQYPIVHRYLMAAVGEVLGDAVTPEIAEAWDAVYWIMASVLINYEKALYNSAQVTPGDVFRRATVTAKEPLTSTVDLFTVQVPNAEAPLPGQYTSVGVTLPDGARQLRQYSITGGNATTWQFAVQRDGEVSTFLHDHVGIGDSVEVTLPAGDLVLEEADTPVVLISRGIGSTPMVGMLAALVEQAGAGSERAVYYLHADSSAESDAQRAVAQGLVSQLANGHYVEQYEGHLELSDLSLPSDATYYLCGGTAFLQDMRRQLADAEVPDSAVHFELFSPNDWLMN